MGLPSSGILNISYLDRLMETTFKNAGKESFIELIDLYAQESEINIRKISESISNPSLDELKKNIHSLRGSSANMGALQIYEICDRMETSLKQSPLHPSSLQDDLHELSQRNVATILALKEYIRAR